MCGVIRCRDSLFAERCLNMLGMFLEDIWGIFLGDKNIGDNWRCFASQGLENLKNTYTSKIALKRVCQLVHLLSGTT